jgi:hypothetical protein
MSEPIHWNIYTELEAEVIELWQLVQETLASFNLLEPTEKEVEVAGVFGANFNRAPFFIS